MIINACAVLAGLVAACALFMFNRGAPISTINLVIGISFALSIPAIIRAFRDFYRALH